MYTSLTDLTPPAGRQVYLSAGMASARPTNLFSTPASSFKNSARKPTVGAGEAAGVAAVWAKAPAAASSSPRKKTLPRNRFILPSVFLDRLLLGFLLLLRLARGGPRRHHAVHSRISDAEAEMLVLVRPDDVQNVANGTRLAKESDGLVQVGVGGFQHGLADVLERLFQQLHRFCFFGDGLFQRPRINPGRRLDTQQAHEAEIAAGDVHEDLADRTRARRPPGVLLSRDGFGQADGFLGHVVPIGEEIGAEPAGGRGRRHRSRWGRCCSLSERRGRCRQRAQKQKEHNARPSFLHVGPQIRRKPPAVMRSGCAILLQICAAHNRADDSRTAAAPLFRCNLRGVAVRNTIELLSGAMPCSKAPRRPVWRWAKPCAWRSMHCAPTNCAASSRCSASSSRWGRWWR